MASSPLSLSLHSMYSWAMQHYHQIIIIPFMRVIVWTSAVVLDCRRRRRCRPPFHSRIRLLTDVESSAGRGNVKVLQVWAEASRKKEKKERKSPLFFFFCSLRERIICVWEREKIVRCAHWIAIGQQNTIERKSYSRFPILASPRFEFSF